MSLSEWQKNGWIKAHRTSPEEIADLLALAARDLKDARAKGLSDDWSFNIAYNAALQSATAALVASGYTAAKGESSHFRVIQSLSHTMGLDPDAVGLFEQYRKKRSMSIYSAAGVITRAEAKAIAAFSKDLLARVRLWLEENHQELLE